MAAHSLEVRTEKRRPSQQVKGTRRLSSYFFFTIKRVVSMFFSPAQPSRYPFHPPTHRLLCNRLPGTRALPKHPQRSTLFLLRSVQGWPLQPQRAINNPRLLLLFVIDGWSPPVTCDGCRNLSLRSLGAMARRSVRRSVQTTSRTDQVCGAKQRQGAAASPIAEQEAIIRLHSLCASRPCPSSPEPLREAGGTVELVGGLEEFIPPIGGGDRRALEQGRDL